MPSPPTDRPPPLTAWQHTWRYLLVLLISAVALVDAVDDLWRDDPTWLAADLLLGALCLIALAFRRRHPVLIAVATTLASTVSGGAAGASVLAYVSLCTRRRWVEVLTVGALGAGSGLVYGAISPGDTEQWYVSFTFSIVFTGVLAATGMYIGARRELIATLHDRAERAEREQALRVAQARANERARIAREMHDVLAHRISLVAMHAGALAYRTDLGPEETRRTAGVIQQGAHQALGDLRAVLGLLRDPDRAHDGSEVDVPERPQPTLCDVPALVDEARAAGTRVTLTDEVRDGENAPATIGRNAYRMIQEALTNARKHAPHTPVSVSLAGQPGDELRIEVRNPLPLHARPGGTPGGLGLVGVAERAALSGGRLEHGPRGDEFVVCAWLPWSV